MRTTASKFNALNGTIVTREAIENLLLEAKKNEQTEIVDRLTLLLKNFPDAPNFDFEITHNATEKVPNSIIECLDCEEENHEAIFGLGKPVTPNDIYDQITNMVIEMLDKEIDFDQEWNSLESGYNFAYNFVSKKPYRGINQFLLGSKKIYDPKQPLLQNPYYLTFEQIKDLKGKLIKGSKAKMVIYYVRLYQYEQAEPKLYFSGYDEKKFVAWIIQNKSKINVLNGSNPLSIESFASQCLVPILKYYNVFSAVDVEGIDFDLDNFQGKGKIIGIEGKNHDKLEIAEAIINNYPQPKPTMRFGGDRAFYRPSQDLVQMPELKQFNYVQGYYTTFFHELIHSTGSKDRLNRVKGKEFGDKDYAFEELVAELGAMFLCAEAGILHYTKRNSAGYLKSWREALLEEIKKDNRFFFKASSQSQKAVDFMLDRNADGVSAYELNNDPAPKLEIVKAKTKTTVKPTKSKVASTEGKFLKEYNEIKSKYKNEVVLVRNNNFYIAIGDDAKILYIVLGVEKRTINGNVISGFVASQVDDAKVELVKAGYKVILSDEINEVKKVKKTATSDVKTNKSDIKNNNSDVQDYSIDKINIDKKRFQNRSKLNENTVNNIVKNYNSAKFDAIVVWKEPSTNKVFILAGHHRFEAMKKRNAVVIPVKFFKGTEAEAIHYAKVESNSNRTMETDVERAKIYREMRENGASKKEVREEAEKNEGKNANGIINLSYLKPNGITIQSVESLTSSDKQNKLTIEKIADWIGEAIKMYSEKLNYSHEKEMFDFLTSDASTRIKSKAEFTQKVTSIAGGFDFDGNEPLNLKRFKYVTQGESVYEEEYKKLQTQIDDAISQKENLKDRIKNPDNPNFIDLKDEDYNSVLNAMDKEIENLNIKIKFFQNKIIELRNKKGSYTKAGGNQPALFGTTKTELNGLVDGLVVNAVTSLALGEPEISDNSKNVDKDSLAYRMANKNNIVHEYYKIPNPEIAKFLGKVEKKKKESVVITIAGGQGSMKTRLCFQYMNCFAQNYKVGHASIEEHPESALYEDKIHEYLDQKALSNIKSPEISSIDDVHKLIRENDVVVIDSFSKLLEMQKGIGLDKDFRKAYDGKLFIIIYQLTSDGKMRGGSSSQFDGDIISFIEKMPNYEDNYCYHDKNRYNKENLEDLKFNIFSGKLVRPIEEPIAVVPVANQFSFVVN